MIITFYKYTCLVLLLVMVTHYCPAQQKGKYVYQDSSIIYQNAKTADTDLVAVEENTDTQQLRQNEKNIDKTNENLLFNKLFIISDSVNAIKSQRQFAYAKILDSLLKDLQHKKALKFSAQTVRFSIIDRFFSSPITKIFFWSLATLLVVLILVKLFFTKGFFYRSSNGSNVNALQEELGQETLTADYTHLITQSILNKDYRLATRYLYLQSLQKLMIAGAISYTLDKTNHQYLVELNDKPYNRAFAALTLQYEYAWYGEFNMDEPRFIAIQKMFTSFNKQV